MGMDRSIGLDIEGKLPRNESLDEKFPCDKRLVAAATKLGNTVGQSIDGEDLMHSFAFSLCFIR